MLAEKSGEAGFGLVFWQQKLQEAQAVYERIQSRKLAGELGFTKLPNQEAEVVEVEKLAAAIRQEFSNVVVVGIGGSDLGTRALHRALNHQFYNLREKPRLFFLGDTTDPAAIQEVLEVVTLPETVFLVISKSGNTIEQLSTYTYVRQKMIEKVGAEPSKKHFICVTDAQEGTLRQIVEREGYRSLPFPFDVGGRFSVFSAAGLLPLAVVGVHIRALLHGARDFDQLDGHSGPAANSALQYALLQYESFQAGRPISVFMPYIYGLRDVSQWFRQLWAESLGKSPQSGPTPLASLGPTDQHSQMQLYMEGPKDKVVTFVMAKESAVDLKLPESFADLEGVNYLSGHSFFEILEAEYQASVAALAQAGRPSCTIYLEKVDAYHLGQLLYMLELAVTYGAALFQVNVFDQPGVESGKKHMYGILGRPGYEEWNRK